MTTFTTIGVHRWSLILRVLAPGPVALGMRACVDPTVWHAMRTKRYLALRPGEDRGEAREAQQ